MKRIDEQRMMQFTEIRPVVMEDTPDAHNVFLVVGGQQFMVSQFGCETKQEAEWMRDQLCQALENIVEQTRSGKT
jgi:hypothetical protein